MEKIDTTAIKENDSNIIFFFKKLSDDAQIFYRLKALMNQRTIENEIIAFLNENANRNFEKIVEILC